MKAFKCNIAVFDEIRLNNSLDFSYQLSNHYIRVLTEYLQTMVTPCINTQSTQLEITYIIQQEMRSQMFCTTSFNESGLR